ncbi:MAG: nucleoside triphosphate pyrophosphohydrolase [Segetibacter sp.]
MDVDEKGNWIIKKSGSNWDWKPSLDNKEAFKIAEMSYKVSLYLNKPLIIMFFINYHNLKIHAEILPWELIHQIPEFSETISERMFNRNKITVSNRKDFDLLKKRNSNGYYENNKITIHLKLDPNILRDTHFIKEIGALSKEADFHLEIEGSTLSHVYYILSSQGVKVRCFDLFEPKYERQKFNKLVRDKIPAKISSHGEASVISKIPQNLLIELLKAKVVEEALELQNATDQKNLLEELADIIEIIRSISNVIKIPFLEIEKLAEKNEKKEGDLKKAFIYGKLKKYLLLALHQKRISKNKK